MEQKNARLFSLDLLRGLDIFLLTAIGPLVWVVHRTWGDYDNPAWWFDQVKHPAFGFSTWDVIMPLFVFVSGATVPRSGETVHRGVSAVARSAVSGNVSLGLYDCDSDILPASVAQGARSRLKGRWTWAAVAALVRLAR